MAINPKIKDKAEKIRNEVYGKDVREALASGLEVMSEDVEDIKDRQVNVESQFQAVLDETTRKDIISAPEVTAARVGADGTQHMNLKQRLDSEHDKITAQLAHLDSEHDKITAQLAHLEIQKANRSEVILKSEGVGLDQVKPDLLAAIEGGEGTSFNLLSIPRDYSVTPKKTTFVRKGKNLFEGQFVQNIIVTGSTPNGQVEQKEGGLCAIVEVEPNKTYTASKKKGSSDRFRIGISETYPEVGTKVRFEGYNDNDSARTVTTRENEHYLIIYVSSPDENKEPLEFQVEEGAYQTEYESPYAVRIQFSKRSIPSSSIDFTDANRDIDIKALRNVNSTAFLSGDANSFNVLLAEEKIETKSNGGFVTSGAIRYSLKTGVWDYSHISSNTVVITFDVTDGSLLFYSTGEYVNARTPIIGLIRRNNNTAWILGAHSINGSPVIPFTQSIYDELKVEPVASQFHITDNLYGVYEPSLDYTDPYSLTDYQEVYAIFDDLVDQFPNYISKNLLGYEENNFPIYEYELLPGQVPIGSNSLAIPKFLLSCTHSFEKPAVLGLTKFIWDLCTNWKNNDLLRTLRWNAHFKVVPIVNPWGFNNNERKNSNGVDINRNFPEGWNNDGANGDPSSPSYAGEEPLSERSTQIMDGFLESNKDAFFVIDAHNYNSFNTSGTVLWTRSRNRHIGDIYGGFVQMMSSLIKTEVEFPDEYENVVLGNTGYVPSGGGYVTQAYGKGLNSLLLEMTPNLNEHASHEVVQRFNAQAIGNAILVALRELK